MSEKTIGAQSTLYALGDTMAAPDAADDEAAGPPSGGAERYHYRGDLGEGGMGRVVRMWDEDLLRELAVKTLRDELRSDTGLVQQFLWEARVTASLDHPNVVPVHDLGVTAEGEVYFTMKHVKGTSLADALDRLRRGDAAAEQRFSMPRRLRLFLQVCQAVAFAHERGVLHRDLKPDNIMLGEHGEVQLMDWGLACPFRDSAWKGVTAAPRSVTDHGVSGTPLYMSPEQAAGEELDERSDVYGLGVILYELVSLARAFEGSSVTEILDKVRAGEARPLAEVAPDASPSAVAVIQKAMAREPEARYATAVELGEEVERLLDGRTPLAEDASMATKVARYVVRQDRRLGTLRPIEIDLMTVGAILGGAGAGSLLADEIGGLELVLIAVGVLLSLPFGYRWLRTLRDRD